jgi:hypothetical protein
MAGATRTATRGSCAYKRGADELDARWRAWRGGEGRRGGKPEWARGRPPLPPPAPPPSGTPSPDPAPFSWRVSPSSVMVLDTWLWRAAWLHLVRHDARRLGIGERGDGGGSS